MDDYIIRKGGFLKEENHTKVKGLPHFVYRLTTESYRYDMTTLTVIGVTTPLEMVNYQILYSSVFDKYLKSLFNE